MRSSKTLPTVRRVEVLPYHTLGLFKWQNLGIPYPLDGVRVPTVEEVATAEELLHVADYPDAPKKKNSTKIVGIILGKTLDISAVVW